MYLHKKVAVIIIVVAFFLAGAVTVSAQSSEDKINKIERGLSMGSSGKDVTVLQRLLSSDATIYPEGLITGFFGKLTYKAVQLLQERLGFESVGNVGPKTRVFLNGLLVNSNPTLLLAAAGSNIRVQSLNAPTSLTASAISSQSVQLGWYDTNTKEGGYQVERSPNALTNFAVIATTGANAVSYLNTGLTASTTYYYRVRAFKVTGNVSYSAYSNVAVVTTSSPPDITSPTVPTSVSTTAISCSQINVSWSASTDTGGSGLQGYNVYRNNSLLTTIFAPSTSASDSGLASSTIYTYTVSAFDQAGNQSAQSAPVSVTTPSCLISPPPPTATTTPPISSSGTFQWMKRFAGSVTTATKGTATDANGNVFAVGRFSGPADFGGGMLQGHQIPGVSFHDIFLVKFSPAGNHLWSKEFGGLKSDFVEDENVAVDADGNVFVVGNFEGTADLGGITFTAYGTTASTSGADIFLGKYSGVDGGLIWVKRFGGTASELAKGVAVDMDNNVYITGSFKLTADFGGVEHTAAANPGYGNYDTFLAKYSGADGSHLWSKSFGNIENTDDWVGGMAIDNTNKRVIMTGFYADISIASFSTIDGTSIWSKRLGSAGGSGVAVDLAGNIFATGSFATQTDFGCGTLFSTGAADIYVARFDSLGVCKWSRNFGGPNADAGYSIAYSPSGHVVITGGITQTPDLGGGPLPSSEGVWDAFVAKYSASNGSYVWAKRYGSVGTDEGLSVTLDRSSNVIAGGRYGESIDFGGGVVAGSSLMDGYLLKLGP